MRPRALFVAASALAVAAVAPPARADFDPATGTVRPSADGASFVGFEPAERPPLRVATLRAGALPTLEAGALDALRVAASLQGSSALRVPAGKAVIVGDAATFAALGDARVEVRVWARADGARPSARLVYAPGEIEPRDLSFPNASVDAVETGRATSDGWVEYSTGPVDATIGARTRAAGIVLEADASPLASSGFWVDAVEVRRVGAKPARGACTLATEDAACGAEGACVEGSCVDGAAVWGPLPSLEQRRAIVERQEQYLVRFTSDRAGATNAAARFSPVARAAAESATTARTFWQPFHRSAAEARGAHTRAVGPAHYHRLAWHVATYTRSVWNELLACFGRRRARPHRRWARDRRLPGRSDLAGARRGSRRAHRRRGAGGLARADDSHRVPLVGPRRRRAAASEQLPRDRDRARAHPRGPTLRERHRVHWRELHGRHGRSRGAPQERPLSPLPDAAQVLGPVQARGHDPRRGRSRGLRGRLRVRRRRRHRPRAHQRRAAGARPRGGREPRVRSRPGEDDRRQAARRRRRRRLPRRLGRARAPGRLVPAPHVRALVVRRDRSTLERVRRARRV